MLPFVIGAGTTKRGKRSKDSGGSSNTERELIAFQRTPVNSDSVYWRLVGRGTFGHVSQGTSHFAGRRRRGEGLSVEVRQEMNGRSSPQRAHFDLCIQRGKSGKKLAFLVIGHISFKIHHKFIIDPMGAPATSLNLSVLHNVVRNA